MKWEYQNCKEENKKTNNIAVISENKSKKINNKGKTTKQNFSDKNHLKQKSTS